MSSNNSPAGSSQALPPPIEGALEVGFYEPTNAFRAIPEHVAVMLPDGRLVALVGPLTDAQALVNAHMFKAAPALYGACLLALSLLGGISPTVDQALEEAIALCSVPADDVRLAIQLGRMVPGSRGRFRFVTDGEAISPATANDPETFEHVASFSEDYGGSSTAAYVVRRRLKDGKLFEYFDWASTMTAYEVVEINTTQSGPESSSEATTDNS